MDNLIDTSSKTIQLPRHRYNLRYNRNPTPSLARTNSTMLQRHAQSKFSDNLSSQENTETSGVDTAFSQRASLTSFKTTGHLFSRASSRIYYLQIVIF